MGTTSGTISLEANVQAVVNAINAGTITPYGDFGGPYLYWFQTIGNGLGNIIYTVFDKTSTLGLASYTVRYGNASTIRQILSKSYPCSQIDLQYLVLPYAPDITPDNGTIIG